MDFSITVAFTAGFLTFFTPCIFPLLPVYISLLVGEGAEEIAHDVRKRLSFFINGVAFSLGLMVVFVLMGMSATALGSFFVKNREILRQLGGLLIFLFGLKFLGYLNVNFLDYEKRLGPETVKSNIRILNSFLIGFFFGFGWSPCLGPVLGSILTYTAISTTNVVQGGFYLLVYSIGFTIPLILLAIFFQPFMALFKKARKWIPAIEKTMGAILAVMGVLLIINKISFFEPTLIKENKVEKITTSRSAQQENKITTPENNPLCGINEECATGETIPGTEEPSLQTPFQTDELTLIPKNKPVLIEFYSKNCPVCRSMIPVINAIQRDCVGKNLALVKIDINSPESPYYIKKFGIFGVPTFIFLDASGKEVARLLGYQEPENFSKILKIITEQKCNFFSTIN